MKIDRKIRRTVEILEEEFGVPTWRSKDPLDELVVTILSQNTNDRNRDLAYRRLREAFPTWRKLLDADLPSVEEAIRPAGLGGQKSGRIKETLEWVVKEFNGFTLSPLDKMSDDAVIDLLTARKGIGVKTAAVVLAFGFGRDICPVDTHVHRIAGRLGWVNGKTTAEATFHAIRPHIPTGKAASFHLNLLKFGRTICTARNPGCGGCPLQRDCTWIKNKSVA